MNRSADPLAALDGVVVDFAGERVLDHVSLDVDAGEIVTLVGLNGAGKSTLVRVLVGLQRVTGGQVRRRPGLRVGYTPQQVRRDPTLPLTLIDFVRLGRRQSVARDTVIGALREVGVEARAGTQLAHLSGGEMQRVLIARALLRDPQLLVLDEPLAGIDMHSQTEVYRLIDTVRQRSGCGVLLVSHELHVVMAATDRVVCLNHHVCCTGHPSAVAVHPEFRNLFGARVAAVMAPYSHHHDHRHDATGVAGPIGDSGSRGPSA